MASDYQGETIQVFVFHRGKFLGYQCFGQDRITVGGAPEMDLPLPDCPETEGFWDVYTSRGALYAWFRSPAGGNGKEGHEDPRKVQPLDSLSLGEYRLQAKLLVGEGLHLESTRTEEESVEEEASRVAEQELIPEEAALVSEEESAVEEPTPKLGPGGEDEEAADAWSEPTLKEDRVQEIAEEAVEQVEGISLDYARSIWREEAAEALAEAKEMPGPVLEPEEEGVGEKEPRERIDLDYADLWGLSEESDSLPRMDEGGETGSEEPGPRREEASAKDEIEEWIGFGLEEEEKAPVPVLEEPTPDRVVETGLCQERPDGDPPAEEPISLAEEEEPAAEAPVLLEETWEAPSVEEPISLPVGEEPSVEERIPPAEKEGPPDEEPTSPAEKEGPSAEEPISLAGEEGPSAEEPISPAEAEQPPAGEASLEAVGEPAAAWDGGAEDLEELVPPRPEPDEEEAAPSPLAGGSDGLVEGMSEEERARFWGQVAQDACAGEDAAPPPEEIVFEQENLPEDEDALEEEPTPVNAPAAAGEPPECANTAVAIDEAGEDEAWDFEDEEEEDEAEQDVTYFSLVKELFPDRDQPLKAHRGDHRALEVVRFRGGDVQDVGYLESGGAYTIRKGWSRSLWKRQGGVPPDFNLVRLKNGGLAELHIQDAVKGRLYSEEGSQDLRDLRDGKRRRFGLKGKASWLPLPADTWAVLRVNSGRYLVRYVTPRPKPVVQPLRPKVSMSQFKLVSLSMLSHLLLIMVVGLAVPDRTLEGYNRTDQFARIDPDALKALKPPPPPKKPDKPKPKAKKKPTKPKPKPKVASKHRIPKSAKKSPVPTKGKAAGGGGKKKVDVAQTGLLAALGSPDAGVLDAKGNSEVLLAAVTNLDAVAVPSDSTTFNLAGVAGKLATSEIQVPTSDVIETVGAAQLIKNGDGTLGAMASKGSGEVRAVVHEPPKAKISISGGMSREAVLKVVNAHLDEVRDCYERELLHNPGVSGKILMEWLIQLDGSVRYAKTKFTNIGHSSDLHTCLQAQVVTWTFPRPKGGQEVLVTFPFLFESMGF